MFTGILALILTIGAKITAFARDVSLSLYFGAGSATDAFFIANMVPGICWAAFLASANLVFLPLYVRANSSSDRAGRKLAVEACQIFIGLGVVVGGLCFVAAEIIVAWTAPGAAVETKVLAVELTRLMAFGFVFSGYVGIQNAIQQARGRSLAPLAVPLVNNLIAIIGIVAAAWLRDIRIAVAAAVGAWAVQAPIQRWQTWGYYHSRFSFRIRRETLHALGALSLPVMIGTFLDQINIYVGLYIASGLGEGAISQLNYASRLALFLATTFSMLVAYFLFPRLAREAFAGDDEASAETLAIGLTAILAVTLPAAILSVLLRDDVIAIIYGQGALDAEGIASTAAAYGLFGIGIVFIAMRELLNRLFFSHQRNWSPFVIGAMASLINFAASWWLARDFGIAGVALGASISAGFYFMLQAIVILVWKPVLMGRSLVAGVAGCVGAVAPAALATAAILPMFAEMGSLSRIMAATMVFATLFAPPFAFFAKRLRMFERLSRR